MSSGERHARVKELFLAARARAAGERAAFLAARCGDDDDLRDEVESLLVHDGDESAARQLDTRSALQFGGAAAPTMAAPTLADYRLLEKVGEGGMGEVYAGQQERPVRRKVAIKLIKPGMDSKEVVARFESERQALALMDHPNIAKVLDAGVTDQGRPYFAMEYVPGIPITDYCDKHRLSIRERLELFIPICLGVQHAHQKGVIHRDMKPSNVLVTSQDGAAVPKIIDFGVAKATAQRLTDKTLHTQLGQWIGTPQYMSPEQAEMSGLDVDTRTDVYSLGVLLYELLVGARPFEPADLAELTFDAMRRWIREEEPARPSTRVSGLGDDAPTLASKRRREATELAHDLRGDLDWITMKAIEKDRTRRYASPSELANDVGRHLRDEPVLASPPSAAYRAAKFMRRNRGLVAATALIFAALVAGTTAATWGLIRARRAEAAARQQAAAAAQVSRFMTGIFQVADPVSGSEGRGSTITARELLDRGAAEIETDLRDQPLVQGRLLATMATVYHGLGLYKRADTLAQRALALLEQELPPDDPELVDPLFEAGWLAQILGEEARGQAIAERCFAIADRSIPGDDPRQAKVLLGKAVLAKEDGRNAEAERLLRHALALWDAHPEARDRFTGFALDELGRLHSDRGDLDEAARLVDESLEFRSTVLGANHPDMAQGLNALGDLLGQRGEHEQAAEVYERRRALEEKTLGPDHPELVDTLIELGRIRASNGDHADAWPLYERAVAIREKSFGRDHARVAHPLHRFAVALHNAGLHDRARATYERAIALLDDDQDDAAPTLLADYGSLLRQLGERDEARRFYERALALLATRGGEAHGDYGAIAESLGHLHTDQGDWTRALERYRAALRSRRARLGEDARAVGWSTNSVGFALLRLGELDQAEAHFDRAHTILEKTAGDASVDVAWVLKNRGELLTRRDRDDEAEKLLEQALAVFTGELGDAHVSVGWTLYGLSWLRYRADDIVAARDLHARALAIEESALGRSFPNLPRSYYNLACLNAVTGEAERALDLLEKAIELGFAWPGIEQDDDLESVRAEPRYGAAVAEIRRRNL